MDSKNNTLLDNQMVSFSALIHLQFMAVMIYESYVSLTPSKKNEEPSDNLNN